MGTLDGNPPVSRDGLSRCITMRCSSSQPVLTHAALSSSCGRLNVLSVSAANTKERSSAQCGRCRHVTGRRLTHHRSRELISARNPQNGMGDYDVVWYQPAAPARHRNHRLAQAGCPSETQGRCGAQEVQGPSHQLGQQGAGPRHGPNNTEAEWQGHLGQLDARDDPGNLAGRFLPLDDEMGFGFDASRRYPTPGRTAPECQRRPHRLGTIGRSTATATSAIHPAPPEGQRSDLHHADLEPHG
jgi:hypothetical protein